MQREPCGAGGVRPCARIRPLGPGNIACMWQASMLDKLQMHSLHSCGSVQVGACEIYSKTATQLAAGVPHQASRLGASTGSVCNNRGARLIWRLRGSCGRVTLSRVFNDSGSCAGGGASARCRRPGCAACRLNLCAPAPFSVVCMMASVSSAAFTSVARSFLAARVEGGGYAGLFMPSFGAHCVRICARISRSHRGAWPAPSGAALAAGACALRRRWQACSSAVPSVLP